MKQVAIGVLTTIFSGLAISIISLISDVAAMEIKIKGIESLEKEKSNAIIRRLDRIETKLDRLYGGEIR